MTHKYCLHNEFHPLFGVIQYHGCFVRYLVTFGVCGTIICDSEMCFVATSYASRN